MVLLRNELYRYNTNSSFVETINIFQDCDIKESKKKQKTKRPKKEKKNNFKTTRIRFYFIDPV